MATPITSITSSAIPTSSSAQVSDLKSAESYRRILSNTYSSLSKICSLKENDPERLRLQEQLDLSGLIKSLEESLGIHSENDSHSISSKPILIAGLGKDYSRQWRTIINSLLVLSKLHELRFNGNENAYDKSKVAFNLEYSKLMKFFYEGNSDLRSTNVSDIKSRLLYFSRQHYIGGNKFALDVQRGRNLLALSSWIGGEFCKKTHPIPNIHFTKPPKLIETPSSVAAKSRCQQRSFSF